MNSLKYLDELLSSLGGKDPSAIKKIEGSYDYGDFELIIDPLPDDPARTPFLMRARLSIEQAGYPAVSFKTRIREIAARDFLARSFNARTHFFSLKTGGKGGRISIDRPTGEMLETSAVVVGSGKIEVRFTVDLPLHNNTISGVQSVELFLKRIPGCVRQSLFFDSIDVDSFTNWVEAAEDAEALRSKLGDLGLAAFVADGSVLTGNARKESDIPFQSPDELAVTVELPNKGEVRGMGIPKGITVIAGGFGHGKSTLLSALAVGVYNHIPGDGRELVITALDAAFIQSEPGRRIELVDISPFISRTPDAPDTHRYCTEEASPLHSNAAAVMEALEIGTSCLLFDEDTSAAGFMTRDARMQALVPGSEEAVTTLVDMLPFMRDRAGISAIVATGTCGDFFELADTVIIMRGKKAFSARKDIEKIVRDHPSGRVPGPDSFAMPKSRRPAGRSLDTSVQQKTTKLRPRGVGYVQYGDEFIDMSKVSQLVSASQARGIARGLSLLRRLMDGSRSLADAVREVVKRVDTIGLDTLSNRCMGDLSAFRAHELAAAVNRIKNMRAT